MSISKSHPTAFRRPPSQPLVFPFFQGAEGSFRLFPLAGILFQSSRETIPQMGGLWHWAAHIDPIHFQTSPGVHYLGGGVILRRNHERLVECPSRFFHLFGWGARDLIFPESPRLKPYPKKWLGEDPKIMPWQPCSAYSLDFR